jgi:hypothetical protein
MARHTIRLTVDNLDELREGDVIIDGEDLGPVRSVRLTNDGYGNARVYCVNGDDILGLPSTIEVDRII